MIVGGIALALPRLATGSLWMSIGIHFAFDFLLVLLVPNPAVLPGILDSRVSHPTPWFGGSESAGWIDLAAQLAWLAALWRFVYLRWRFRDAGGAGC